MTRTRLAPRLSTSASPRPRLRWRGLLRWTAALALVAMAAALVHQLALQSGLSRLRETADHRLDMLATGLDADLARFDYLPALLEMTPVVPAMLATPADPVLRSAVNRYLHGVNASVGAEMLYVLDAGGTSLAASDWDKPGTTIGQDLSFRPYVVNALASGRGRFYGVGITSRKPGYYLSYALRRDEHLRGVVAVKINIEDAEAGWRKLPGEVLLADERGVVILSTRSDFKYRPLAPLDERQNAEVQRSRPYGDATLQPLRWTALAPLGPDDHSVLVDGVAHLVSSRGLQRAPWRLMVLDPLAPVLQAARFAAVTASLGMAVLLLLAVTRWQRQRAVRQRLASQAALQAANDSLESTVAARTAQLRDAQAELVHAGKMAALGQMSAGMVHELNQPLTALRTLSDSAGILLDQQRHDEVRDNLQRIAGMVDRLARLTTQLKTFAYKNDHPPVATTRVPLRQVIEVAQAIVGDAAQSGGIRTEVDLQPPDLAVMAVEPMLVSVLVNLMQNAIEAMPPPAGGRLRLAAFAQAGRVVLTVTDTGPGIRADILPRLFEPFVTSKAAGEGLGLGLTISAQLLRASGGSLRVSSQARSGACFVVDLPLAAGQE